MRNLLSLFMCVIALSACSSDDEIDILANEIVLTPQYEKNYRFGQYQIHSASVDVKESGVNYEWSFSCVSKGDEGFTSTSERLDWWPRMVGVYTIKVTLRKGSSEKTLSKNCKVEMGDGMGFHGQLMSDVLMNETMYFAYYYQTTPETELYNEKFNGTTYQVMKVTDRMKGEFRRYYFKGGQLDFCVWAYL